MLLVVGCSGDSAPGGSPTPTAPAATPPTPPEFTFPPFTPAAPEPLPSSNIVFDYEPPEQPCAPPDALTSLPHADTYPYVLVEPTVLELSGYYSVCVYQRADLVDAPHHLAEQDHVKIYAGITLQERRSGPSATRPEIPIESNNLDDWTDARLFGGKVKRWSEGCSDAPDLACPEGQEPDLHVDAAHADFSAWVGNLYFDVTVSYISENLPEDVHFRNHVIFRELVLADIQQRSHHTIDDD